MPAPSWESPFESLHAPAGMTLSASDATMAQRYSKGAKMAYDEWARAKRELEVAEASLNSVQDKLRKARDEVRQRRQQLVEVRRLTRTKRLAELGIVFEWAGIQEVDPVALFGALHGALRPLREKLADPVLVADLRQAGERELRSLKRPGRPRKEGATISGDRPNDDPSSRAG